MIYYKKRRSVRSSKKEHALSDGIVDFSSELRFPSKQKFRGSLPPNGGSVAVSKQNSLQKCMKLTQ